MPNLCIVEIKVSDLDKGRDFYSNVLGFDVKSEAYLPNVLVLEHEGVDLILHIANKPIQIEYPDMAQSLLIFQVDDIDKTCEELKAHKVEIIDGPRDSPPGSFLAFKDPFGNCHGMMQLRENG